ncbi:hypothetical protein ACUXIL_003318 [Ralstonia pickettii]
MFEKAGVVVDVHNGSMNGFRAAHTKQKGSEPPKVVCSAPLTLIDIADLSDA